MPRLRPRHATLAATLVLLACQAHATDLVQIDWSPTGAFERALSVPAGKFAEVCGRLAAPASVAWRFQSDRAMDFNIHYHQGKQVQYPARLAAVDHGGDTLKVTAPQDYCWMWTNQSGTAARLTLSLQRQ